MSKFTSKSNDKRKRAKGNGNTSGRNSKSTIRDERDARGNTSLSKSTKTDVNPSNINDPIWYSMDNQLVNNAGQISFYNPNGAQLEPVAGYTGKFSMPGIMAINMVPIPGVSKNPYSPINVAARRLFDAVNYKNSRNFTYESSDLMIYSYVTASAYAYYAWMKRIYGIMNTYSNTNWFMPDGLLRAIGVSASDIRSHLSDLRYYVNYFGRKLSVLTVPAKSSVYARYIWLNTNLFTDADTLKAGIYIPNFTSFYRYAANVKSSGTVIGGTCYLTSPTKSSSGLSTFKDIMDFGESLIQPLVEDQDIGNMSADILKSVDGAFMVIDPMPDDYAVAPVYSEEVLDQIHNARAYGFTTVPKLTKNDDGTVSYDDLTSGVVYQRNNTIYSSLKLKPSGGGVASNVIGLAPYNDTLIDTILPNPTAADVMTMTRLVPMASFDSKTNQYELMYAGTEVVTNFTIVYNTATGSSVSTSGLSFMGVNMSASTTVSDMVQYMNTVNGYAKMHTKFTHAPRLIIGCRYDEGTKVTEYSSDISDVFNYTVIHGDTQLRKLHEVAVLSELSSY